MRILLLIGLLSGCMNGASEESTTEHFNGSVPWCFDKPVQSAEDCSATLAFKTYQGYPCATNAAIDEPCLATWHGCVVVVVPNQGLCINPTW